MAIVCVNRPNRSKRRTYTARDVARIACYAVKAGESREAIVRALRDSDCIGDEMKRREKELLEEIAMDELLDAVETLLEILVSILGRRIPKPVRDKVMRVGKRLYDTIVEAIEKISRTKG